MDGRMYYVGDIGIKTKRLVRVTYGDKMIGIKLIKPGVYLGDIGNAIQTYVDKHNYSVVRNYTVHGIRDRAYISYRTDCSTLWQSWHWLGLGGRYVFFYY